MLDSVMPAAFEDIDESHQVRVHIRMWILNRVAHTGLGRQIDHHFERLPAEKCLEAL